MTNPFLTHWQIQERPFEPVTDSRFYFQSRAHAEALARLGYLVAEETMYLGMLTGEIGCGKTMTRHLFASQADPDRICVIQFENSFFRLEDHLKRILVAFGLEREAAGASNLYDCYALFRDMLDQLHRLHQRHLLLLFDEAQDMDDETLSQINRLTNLNDQGRGLLTIVLIGQPELRRRVAVLPSLDQRIGLRFHLGSLSPEDTGPYLAHRLRVAGHPTGEVFDADAVRVLGASGRSVPRELNRLAKLSMEHARAQGRRHVSGLDIETVLRDLRRHQLNTPATLIPSPT
ncbi:MAG: AAA family ATPase [Candidatus Methylacidiphilales bacterium]|nr:AAA family ATPase [Candidatus Methylacidiphilales bacterium]